MLAKLATALVRERTTPSEVSTRPTSAKCSRGNRNYS